MKYIRKNSFNGLEILLATESNFSFPTHFHENVCLTLIYEGVEHAFFEDKHLTTASGQITVLAPNIVHSNPYNTNDLITFSTFYIDIDVLKYFANGRNLNFDFISIKDDYLFKLLHFCIKFSRAQELLYNKILSKALTMLVNQYLVNCSPILEKRNSVFKNLIEDLNAQDFSLQEASKRLNINQFKLIRIFKEETGMTPKQYFNYNKILKSKKLLAKGIPIIKVIDELNFHDYSHFNKQFKRFTGVNPEEYLF
jgi:AraC-like DNA-binding protein